ncbi:MAG: hypothetical protein R3309_01700 [Reinekea sp.]|nr:hypothetical protein [Reinekea sp.]
MAREMKIWRIRRISDGAYVKSQRPTRWGWRWSQNQEKMDQNRWFTKTGKGAYWKTRRGAVSVLTEIIERTGSFDAEIIECSLKIDDKITAAEQFTKLSKFRQKECIRFADPADVVKLRAQGKLKINE